MPQDSARKLIQSPWECHHPECRDRWHMATYSRDKTGPLVSRYSDGRWERCLASEIPSERTGRSAWNRYLKFIERTGTDPLDVVPMPSIPARWQAMLRFSGGEIETAFIRSGKSEPWQIIDNGPLDLRRTVARIALGCHSASAFTSAARTSHLTSHVKHSGNRVRLFIKSHIETDLTEQQQRDHRRKSAITMLVDCFSEAS